MNAINTNRYQKRDSREQVARHPVSPRLREASTMISAGRIEAALTSLDQLAVDFAGDLEAIAKVLAMVGDAQMRAGRFDAAAATYRRTLEMLADDSLAIRIWIRPAIGEIRALLKGVRADEAWERAHIVWERARQYHGQLEELLGATNDELKKKGKIRVGKRPIRPSVVLTRLGNAFQEEGYVGSAKEFYQQAVLTSPKGASRARQGMAQIALAEDRNDQAEIHARESIQMGKFQAKTIPAWPMLIIARVKQDKAPLDAEIYTGLILHAEGQVRDRAILEITKCLRAYGDELWRQIAREWSARGSRVDEVIEIELAKMLLADAKLTGANPRKIALAAYRILRSRKVSPGEMVAACKDIVRMKLARGGNPGVKTLAHQVERRFGAEFRNRALHAMAIGCMLERRHDIARQILIFQLSSLPEGEEQWGKDAWALARMEAVLENHAAAADAYLMFAEQSKIPERFRVQGLLRWFEHIRKSGAEVDGDAVLAKLEAVIRPVDDYRVLLDVGRDLAMAPSRFQAIREVVVRDATAKATAAFHAAEKPGQALAILIHLTRRQYYEFGAQGEIVALWEAMDDAKRSWLWSKHSHYWEYLALLFNAYVAVEKTDTAIQIAQEIINDGNPPPEGFVLVGTAYANWLYHQGDLDNAYEHYEWIGQEMPTHPWAAWGHYRLALRDYKKGNEADAVQRLMAVRQCFALKPSMAWMWALDAKAMLLIQQINGDQPDSSLYTEAYLQARKREVKSELAKI